MRLRDAVDVMTDWASDVGTQCSWGSLLVVRKIHEDYSLVLSTRDHVLACVACVLVGRKRFEQCIFWTVFLSFSGGCGPCLLKMLHEYGLENGTEAFPLSCNYALKV